MKAELEERTLKSTFKGLLTTVIILFSVYLVITILFTGQYSLLNWIRSIRSNDQAAKRNKAQEIKNEKIAKENILLQTDEETQQELCNELGYKKPGEKIIKRVN